MLALLILACSDLSRRDAEHVLDDHVSLLAEVEARLDSVESLIVPEPQGHSRGDGDYAYEGYLFPMGANFTDGTVQVAGLGSSTGNGSELTYDVRLTLDEVLVDGTRYDGAFAAQIGVVIADGDVAVWYAVDGEVVATGVVDGLIDMDWRYDASSIDGGRPHYSGTINGRDVSRL